MHFLIEKKRVSNLSFIVSRVSSNNNEQTRKKKLKDKCKEIDMSFYVDIRII